MNPQLKTIVRTFGILSTMGISIEILISIGLISEFIFPKPSSVLICFFEFQADLLKALTETLVSSFFGLIFSLTLGVFVAFAMSYLKNLKELIEPLLIVFQTIPLIALAPMLIIWFGFGVPTVIACSFIVSFFPVLLATLHGVNEITGAQIELFQLYQSSRLKTFIHLQIPTAISYLAPTLKNISGLSVVGAIIGEFIAGSGLGSIIDSSRTQQRLDLLFAALILCTTLGLFYFGLVTLLEKTTLRKYMASNTQRKI